MVAWTTSLSTNRRVLLDSIDSALLEIPAAFSETFSEQQVSTISGLRRPKRFV